MTPRATLGLSSCQFNESTMRRTWSTIGRQRRATGLCEATPSATAVREERSPLPWRRRPLSSSAPTPLLGQKRTSMVRSPNVRFGSLADIRSELRDVRFGPRADVARSANYLDSGVVLGPPLRRP